jgi:uncharacterized GH25 family protein
MKSTFALLALFILAPVSTLLAHALWIETAPKGSTGKAHTVTIRYGEYSHHEYENTDKWYSDVNTFTLWLIGPDGKKEQLTYTAASDRYQASFTPAREGTYTLAVGHSAKEVNHKYVYQFNASAVVQVGKSETVAPVPSSSELYLQPVKNTKGKSGIVKAFYKGQPAAEIEISVSGPTGWSKTFKTDKNGVLEFELLWKGVYGIEGFYTSDETGQQGETPYEHIWRSATLLLDFAGVTQK